MVTGKEETCVIHFTPETKRRHFEFRFAKETQVQADTVSEKNHNYGFFGIAKLFRLLISNIHRKQFPILLWKSSGSLKGFVDHRFCERPRMSPSPIFSTNFTGTMFTHRSYEIVIRLPNIVCCQTWKNVSVARDLTMTTRLKKKPTTGQRNTFRSDYKNASIETAIMSKWQIIVGIL